MLVFCLIMAIYKLGEIFNIKNGNTPPTNIADNWKEELSWYTVPDFNLGTHTQRKISFSSVKKTIPKGTLLLTTTGALLGKTLISLKECWHSQQVTSFQNNEENILTKYLKYWFDSNQIYLKTLVGGTAIPTISKSKIEALEIKVPSIEEQRKIIDIIEPLELEEKRMNKAIEMIDGKIDLFFSKLNSIEVKEAVELSSLIEISNNKRESNEVKIVSVGYDGFKMKKGKIAKVSKIVGKNEFVIGLISKGIPIAFNYQDEDFGVSTAYYVFKPKNENLAYSLYVYHFVKKYWKSFVKASARQGQGFDVAALLLVKLDKYVISILEESSETLDELMSLKNEILLHLEIMEKTKKKAINHLVD